MFAFIFVAGVLNFVLGYFLALAMADPPFLGLLRGEAWRKLGRDLLFRFRRPAVEVSESVSAGEECEVPPDDTNAPPVIASCSELPESWQHMLRDDGLPPGTLAAGILHFLRIEGAAYREQLLTAEARGRQALALQSPLAMEQLAADLRFISMDWSRKQRHAAELIEERVGRLGPAEPVALQFARLAQDHDAQIAEIEREVHALNFRAEGSVACRRMIGELQQLIHLTHKLRDATQVSLGTIYNLEENFGKLDRKLHYDPNTGLLGRLGIESLFGTEFQEGSRPTAALRITLDRFSTVNQRLGTRVGDQTLKAVSRFAAELAATHCENSVMARLAGNEFLLLANEATAEDLTAIGELIRQTFEAAGFDCQGTDISLSLTVSVAAISTDASLNDVISRLDAVREVAFRAGRNRSARWENGAAVLTLPPAMPVLARTITVETAAA